MVGEREHLVVAAAVAVRPQFDVVGPDRCVFGTERPGSGSGKDPVTGKPYDDIKPTIESIEWLTDEQKKGIFEKNAQRLFPRFKL